MRLDNIPNMTLDLKKLCSGVRPISCSWIWIIITIHLQESIVKRTYYYSFLTIDFCAVTITNGQNSLWSVCTITSQRTRLFFTIVKIYRFFTRLFFTLVKNLDSRSASFLNAVFDYRINTASNGRNQVYQRSESSPDITWYYTRVLYNCSLGGLYPGKFVEIAF